MVTFSTHPTHTLHVSAIACQTAPAFGKFMFVGRVPAALSYTGTPEDVAKVAKFGMIGDLRKRVETRIFETVADALKAADGIGATVCPGQSVGCACR